MYQSKVRLWAAGAAVAALALSGCGGGGSSSTNANTSTTEGTLIYNPPLRVAHLTAADLTAQLTADPTGQGAKLLQLVGGTIQCGVDVHHIEYQTVGGAGEATQASGALMVPNGSGAKCSGGRPIVLYAHGTTTVKSYDISNVADTNNAGNGEGVLIAAVFAAQGYIVVAPNYAGYDTSTLSYHPYLNAVQQSKDMIDALTAAHSALGKIPAASTTASGQLFVTGYSQGGYVAMATQRALQSTPATLQTLGLTLTATAPASGPYALAAFGDAVFYGEVNVGATEFTPLLVSSYQHSYGNIYSQVTDVYSPTYAAGIDTLMPGLDFSVLVGAGKLPRTAMFDRTAPTSTANPTLNAYLAAIDPTIQGQFSYGFATSNFLVTNAFRLNYLDDAYTNPDGAISLPTLTATTYALAGSPTNTLRQAFKRNDLRAFNPGTTPMLMCAGGLDPTVFYDANTGLLAGLLSAQVTAGLVTVVDMQAIKTPTSSNPGIAALQSAFQSQITGLGGMPAAAAEYHADVAPYCTAAARGFFDHFVP